MTDELAHGYDFTMTRYTSYTQARANFVKLLDEVTGNREIVIIRRRGAEDVAVIAAAGHAALEAICSQPPRDDNELT